MNDIVKDIFDEGSEDRLASTDGDIDNGVSRPNDRQFTDAEINAAGSGSGGPKDTPTQPDHTQLENHLRQGHDIPTTDEQALPAWAIDDFHWNSSTNTTTGERTTYVRVKPGVVDQMVAVFEGVRAKAFEKVSANDQHLAFVEALTGDFTSLLQTADSLDQYLGGSIRMWLRDRSAQTLIRAFRFQKGAQQAMSRLREDQAVPDGIQSRLDWAQESLVLGGVLDRVASNVDPEGTTNVQNAAWTVLRIEANNAQRTVQNPNGRAQRNRLDQGAVNALLDSF